MLTGPSQSDVQPRGQVAAMARLFPPWFWLCLAAGAALRLYLAAFTEGTYDVAIWQQHAAGVAQYGLIRYYHQNPLMNHPPFISLVMAGLGWLSRAAGIPFGLLLRLPMVLADAGTLALLLKLLPRNRYRLAAAALYWLNPLAIILSGYHGNTDSLLAFVILLSVFFLAQEQVAWGAVALGVSVWVKLPGLLIAPALVFFVPGWRQRARFVIIATVVGVSSYVPALLSDPAVLWANVFAYKGQLVQTTGKQFIWGMRIFLKQIFDQLAPPQQELALPYILFYLNRDSTICLALILILSWLRRFKRATAELALTITGSYAILYGFSNHWSFQYFAWSIPFWVLANPGFATAATLFAGGYIYFLYAYLCGDPWLRGQWDFLGHPFWPHYLELLRNAALLFFAVTACCLISWGAFARAAALWRRLRPKAAAP